MSGLEVCRCREPVGLFDSSRTSGITIIEARVLTSTGEGRAEAIVAICYSVPEPSIATKISTSLPSVAKVNAAQASVMRP